MSPQEPSRRQRGRPNLDQLYDSLQPSQSVEAKSIVNSQGHTFAWVPAGSFQMGSRPEEPGHRLNELPQHEVVFTKPFYLGVQPVTQKDYLALTKSNPSYFTVARGGSLELPVERVSWQDAVKFCELLSALPDERSAGRSYRLPTEAEWEYACRGGTTGTAELSSDVIHSTTAPVPLGRRPANSFGLYDLLGNVWEWCADWYSERYYSETSFRDPTGPVSGTLRVCRGGSWRNLKDCCRPAYRNALAPHSKSSAVGFRVVLEVR